MTRDITTNQVDRAESDVGLAIHLFEFTFFDDATSAESQVRLTTASSDIDVTIDGTPTLFEGVGGVLNFGGIEESTDRSAQGSQISLSGVDQTIVSLLTGRQFRNRDTRIWRAYLDTETAQIVDDPILLFRGKQSGAFSINENWGGDENQPGTVEVSTSVESRLAELQNAQPIRTNVTSHNEMLERAGLATGDTFFQNVPNLAGRRIFWGTEAPDSATDRSPAGGGSSTGDPRGPGRPDQPFEGR